MKQFILLFTVFIALNGAAQLKVKIADDHFNRMEYSKCVDMYSELVVKSTKKGSDSRFEYMRKAAISNFKLFRMMECESYFSKLKEANKLTEEDRKYYVQTMQYLGKYDEAYKLALESKSLHKNNQYFSTLTGGKTAVDALLADSARYSIRPMESINSGMGDFSPTLSNNDLYYATKSSNTKALHTTYGWDDAYFLNIKHAKLVSDSTTSSAEVLKGPFITKAHDGPVSFNSKGDMMIITRNTVEKQKGKDVVRLGIYFSQLVNGKWTNPTPFAHNSPDYNTGHAVLSSDGKSLYFSCDKPGGFGGADIYVSQLDKNGNWTVPQNLGGTVNTMMNELFPFVNKDVLYFASNGHFGLGGLDVFSFKLGTEQAPRNMGYPVNTSFDDFGLISDSLNEKGYFSSNRNDNIDRIYSFKKLPIEILLQGIVYATYTDRESIPNHPVEIKRLSDGSTETVTTNEFGQFQYEIDPEDSYQIWTSKEEFALVREGLIKTTGIKSDSIFYCELPLRPTTLQVRLRVVEMGNNKPIAFAKTTITDYTQNKESVIHTNDEGIVTLKVDRDKTYWAHAAKKGFLDGNIAFNSANENDRIIDLELKLPPIVKGDVFKLENIFYDLNKSSLRSESMLALDKLADFIIKNEVRIELSAHTDARGSDSYNLKLSQARAQSCVDYLISKGVKKSQITAKGYGETKLINKCKNGVECPEDMHQENRRTEVKIL